MTPEQMQGLIPVLSPLVTWLVKFLTEKFGGKLPRQVWPLLCGVAGVLGDWLVSVTTGNQFSALTGVALGLAGVGVREVAKITPPKESATDSTTPKP